MRGRSPGGADTVAPHRSQPEALRERRRRALDTVAATGLRTTDRHIPSTVRVSRGSMMPSSLTAPVATRASEPFSWMASTAATTLASSSSSNSVPLRAACAAADLRHDPGDLLGAHHGDLGRRPQEGEAVVEGAPGHAVGAGAVRASR